MKSSLPALLHKATPATVLLGLTLILTGCTPDQDQYQDEQLLPRRPQHHLRTIRSRPATRPPSRRRHSPNGPERHHPAHPQNSHRWLLGPKPSPDHDPTHSPVESRTLQTSPNFKPPK